MAKETQGGKGIFDLPFYILILHWRKLGEELKQGKYLEAEADTEVIVKKKMPGSVLCVLLFSLFEEPTTQLPNKSHTWRLFITYECPALVCLISCKFFLT